MFETAHQAVTRADPRPERQRPGAALAISNQMVKLCAAYVGRGPTRARATLTPDLVIVTFGDTMTRAEHHLVAAGEAEAVQSMRRTFHRTMRPQATEIVEQALQRTVQAYMADIDTQANTALFAFVLEPRPAPDDRI